MLPMEGRENENGHWAKGEAVVAKSIYKCASCRLDELLGMAENNATLLIPDLQRPYVWKPDQVILLVDSIFRGWPFGTLLTWTYKPEKTRHGIPARPFYTLVSKSSGVKEELATKASLNYQSQYTMVLDGQQRVQSLLLAFGNTKGICLDDTEWRRLSNPLYKARTPGGYTTASLCLDLRSYVKEMSEKNHSLRGVDLTRCLQWVVIDPATNCSKEHKNSWPLPVMRLNAEGFIPLKDMWSKTTADDDDDATLRPLSKGFIQSAFSPEGHQSFVDEFGGEEQLTDDLKEFLRRCCVIKELDVQCLNVGAYEEKENETLEDKQKNRREYDESIVNIFTRLNTSGRTLTREEITFAWLKVSWGEVDNGQTAEEFVNELVGIFESHTSDEVVRALSIIWCDHDAERQGKILEPREFVQANVMQKLAAFLRNNSAALVKSARDFQELEIYDRLKGITDSFYAVTIAWDIYFTGMAAMNRLMKRSREIDIDNKTKELKAIVTSFFSRWAVAPSWAGRWAVNAVEFLQGITKKMWEGIAKIDAAGDCDGCMKMLKDLSNKINATVADKAEDSVRMNVHSRKLVKLYRSRLEIWQARDETRAKCRSLTFKTANSRANSGLHVDHVIAYKAWENRVNNEWKSGALTAEKAASVLLQWQDDVIAQQKSLANFEQKVKADSIEFINNIGNCMLLNAAYNIAKRTKPLSEFMDEMYEFKSDTPVPKRVERDKWIDAMKLSDAFVHPDEHSIEEIAEAVRKREEEINNELTHFIVTPDLPLY